MGTTLSFFQPEVRKEQKLLKENKITKEELVKEREKNLKMYVNQLSNGFVSIKDFHCNNDDCTNIGWNFEGVVRSSNITDKIKKDAQLDVTFKNLLGTGTLPEYFTFYDRMLINFGLRPNFSTDNKEV